MQILLLLSFGLNQVYADCLDDATGAYSEFGGCDIVINTFMLTCDAQFAGVLVGAECPLSCDMCPGVCGDGQCSWDETFADCPADCALPPGCDNPDSTLSILENGTVLYNSSVAIGGFQFKVFGEELIVIGAGGGVAEESGFTISSDEITNNVLGFSLTGTTIPAGCGILVEVDVTGTPAQLTDIIISDPIGGELNFSFYSTAAIFGCMDTDACNYNIEANSYDGSCLYNDCLGVCGGVDNSCYDCLGILYGDNVLDNCGTCDSDPTNDCSLYCAGDIISEEDQNMTFDVCYPCDTCDGWSLSDYSGDIIFLDLSASWCAPCYSSIDFIDNLEEYWSERSSNVKFITALSDINQPYSCGDWGLVGIPGSPTIVEDDGTLFDWFKDSNGQYPSYVLIDHEMKIRAKPSSVIENNNTIECDVSLESISSFDGGCINAMIDELLSELHFGIENEELGYDDGNFENEYIAGSGNFSAIRYSSSSEGENLSAFRWFQYGDGGIFNIKVFEDYEGMPGSEIYSSVQSDDNTDGWNQIELNILVSGDFWVGVKEFSSTRPLGLDTSSNTGNSYERIGSTGEWTEVNGNIAYHAFLGDCGDTCEYTVCDDISACNYNTYSQDGCRYPPQWEDVDGDGIFSSNFDCCGDCTSDIDCLGECGGDATFEDCENTDIDLSGITFVCHPDSVDSNNNYNNTECDFLSIQEALDSESVMEGYCNNSQSAETEEDCISLQSQGFDVEWIHGDTVIVENGTYYENLILQKEITLASRALFDDMSSWIGYNGEYTLNNYNIKHTIINGEHDTQGDDYQSVILINSPYDECISPVIFGFTLQGGDGSNVSVTDEQDNEVTERRGGGFLALNSLPTLNYNYVFECGVCDSRGDCPQAGGGGDISNGDQIRGGFRDYTFGSPECIGDIDLSFNFYRDNDALYGNTLATSNMSGSSIDMTYSIFDVYFCPEEEVTPVWVDVDEGVDVDFDNGVGDDCAITDDVWLSPDGNNDNLGTSETEAFLTIKHAFEMIVPDEDNPITIFLTEGTFSPSSFTGEVFPIVMISNVNIVGQGEELSKLDALWDNRVMIIEYCTNNTISDLTITGGIADGNGTTEYGGGIFINFASPTITNVTISDNMAQYGGGMYLYTSNPTLTNITIDGNTASQKGGGMGIEFFSNPIITNLTITNNEATWAGGMWLWYYSNPILTHVLISDNKASGIDQHFGDHGSTGGVILMDHCNPTLTNVTISGNTSTSDYNGGGMAIWDDSNPTITNSIIWGNTPSYVNMDAPDPWDMGDPGPIITYSNIENCDNDVSCVGWGNIDADPLFTDPENGDYTLGLQECSPCIDAGTTDVDGVVITDYIGSAPDMGAFEADIYDVLYQCHYITENVWISPSGDDNNLGTSEEEAFKTITKALFAIQPEYNNPITIFLTEGTYSPSITGEVFPIVMRSNVNIIGQGEDVTILNAEESDRAIRIQGCQNNIVSDLTITNGLSDYGGGMYIIYSNLTLTNVTIDNNTAEYYGGGMYLNDSNPTLTSVTVANNTSSDGGGMYLFRSSPTLTDLTISGNEGTNSGGGMWLYNSDPALMDVTITGNTANYAGGMKLESSHPTLTNVTISGNESNYYGGGMYIYDSNPTLTHVTISGNESNYYGGGMYLNDSNPTLTDLTISGNETTYSGGGMYVYHSDPTLTDITIDNNTSSNGGGVYIYSSNPTLTNITIDGNTASQKGGGIYLSRDANPTLTNVTISNNTGVSQGGGMYLSSSNPTLTNVTISNNTASNYGGGMYLSSSNPTLTNVTISNNTASNYGGGMRLSSSNPTLTNSIIWGNSPESIYLTSGTPLITYSDIEGGFGGEGNIDADPLFMDPDNDDYILSWDNYPVDDGTKSPCIDTGTADIYGDGEDDITDYYGVAPDMGAYEWYLAVLGCTDETACNFNVDANTDDGSCQYPEENYDCDGNCIVEIDCNGECDGTSVEDECGVCGGSGPAVGECDCDGNVEDECGVCGGDGSSCYAVDLHTGANLISFYTLPEDRSVASIIGDHSGNIYGILGEGVNASYFNGMWLGSLTELSLEGGYWILVEEIDITLSGSGSGYDVGRVYNLHTGANLISYSSINSSDLSTAIPDDVENQFVGILSEGSSAANTDLGWVGSLTHFSSGVGYWVIVTDDLSFSFESGGMTRTKINPYIETLPSDNTFNVVQSTNQAFYFVEDIILNDDIIEDGDWLLSYKDNILTGIRQWQGLTIDIPAMGVGENTGTDNYFEDGEIPSFKLLKESTREIITLEGDIPTWSSNGMYMLQSLTEMQPVPAEFSLANAYPNPFNPTTTLNFALPIESDVSLSIYNLQGREIVALVNGNMKAGYHSVAWNADAQSSGIYFVRMFAGSYTHTRKLMLVK